MAVKRSWSKLSPAYRKRLERGGITKKLYEGGVNLQVARGHGKEVFKVIENDDIREPSNYKTIKWFDSRQTWLNTRHEGVDSAKWPPHVPPWWIIFS